MGVVPIGTGMKLASLRFGEGRNSREYHTDPLMCRDGNKGDMAVRSTAMSVFGLMERQSGLKVGRAQSSAEDQAASIFASG